MEQFQKVGDLIEERWRKENYSEQRFPEIAEQALLQADLPSRVDPWDIIRWVNTSITLPDQKDVEGRFGNPPVTVYAGPRFYIDVYYWLDGTTTIHQHAFCGAFQVLLGSSIHSHYDFREDRILSEHFSVGELALKQVQLLKVGDVKQIRAGREYIHSLFHLDRPSATITVRTEHTASAAPQYDYRKPYFAIDPFFRNQQMSKKLQAINLIVAMKHKEADAMIGDVLTTSDFHTVFYVLSNVASQLKSNQLDELFGMSTGQDRFNALLDKARTIHGELVGKFVQVLAEQERQYDIVMRRGSITGEEHRFFLALLLNVPGREKILELVKSRFPETDPVEKVLDWVEELSQTRVLGSKEANALGIENFDHNFLLAFEDLLKGTRTESCGREGGNHQPTNLDYKVSEELMNVPLFKSMLST